MFCGDYGYFCLICAHTCIFLLPLPYMNLLFSCDFQFNNANCYFSCREFRIHFLNHDFLHVVTLYQGMNAHASMRNSLC